MDVMCAHFLCTQLKRTQMKKLFTKITLSLSVLILLAGAVQAQNADTTVEFRPSGKLWGYAFGDYAWKGGTDDWTTPRGGSNQYTNVPVNSNIFQWRRIYLGYDYNISPKFSSEFLLAAEDDWAAGVLGQAPASVTVNTTTGVSTKVGLGGNGDVLMNTKFSPYVKLANIRWKNILKGQDLIFGQSATPTFAKNGSGMASEEVWAYRSIERTITDIRRTSSYDFGITLQGKFGEKGNVGYTLMVANGTGAKPEGDMFKWFYGDVWFKLLNKKLIVDLYQDYNKMHWTAAAGPQLWWHNDRYMTKLFVAYTVPKFTVGLEVFSNTLTGDLAVKGTDKNTYYRTTKAMGESIFVRGRITKDKLGFFARFDNYDPSGNLNTVLGEPIVASYSATTSQYDPTTKEMFTTFGIDFTPTKNVHIMPNVWLNTYTSALDANGSNSAPKPVAYTAMSPYVTNAKGTDAVYRLTIYYIYGK